MSSKHSHAHLRNFKARHTTINIENGKKTGALITTASVGAFRAIQYVRLTRIRCREARDSLNLMLQLAAPLLVERRKLAVRAANNWLVQVSLKPG